MPFPLLVVAVLAASPVNLVMSPVKAVQVEASVAAFLNEHLGQQLASQPGIRVTTQRDIEVALGIERQKQLLGCSEENCSAELIGALGGEGLVVATVARVGNLYTLDVKVLAHNGSTTLAFFSGRASTEDGVLELIEPAVIKLGAEVWSALRSGVERPSAGVQSALVSKVPPAAPAPRRVGPWALGGAGILVLAGGAVSMAVASATEQRLRGPNSPITNQTDADIAVRDGQTWNTVGIVGLAVGGTAVAAAGVWLAIQPSAPVKVSAFASPNGAAITFSGSFR